jgi:hypothetical protein
MPLPPIEEVEEIASDKRTLGPFGTIARWLR